MFNILYHIDYVISSEKYKALIMISIFTGTFNFIMLLLYLKYIVNSLMNDEQLLFNGYFQALLSIENPNGLECLRARVKNFSIISFQNLNITLCLAWRRRFLLHIGIHSSSSNKSLAKIVYLMIMSTFHG